MPSTLIWRTITDVKENGSSSRASSGASWRAVARRRVAERQYDEVGYRGCAWGFACSALRGPLRESAGDRSHGASFGEVLRQWPGIVAQYAVELRLGDSAQNDGARSGPHSARTGDMS